MPSGAAIEASNLPLVGGGQFAVLGLLTPFIAAGALAAGSLFAVTSSLRLRRVQPARATSRR